jgi:hypothetical protein
VTETLNSVAAKPFFDDPQRRDPMLVVVVVHLAVLATTRLPSGEVCVNNTLPMAR